MSRADDLRALLARVEEATEGSPELDEAIHALLLPDDPFWCCIVEGRRLVAVGDPDRYVICPPQGLGAGSRMRADSWATSAHVASYTTTLDAPVYLIGRVLPGWSWAVAISGGRFRASVTPNSPVRPMPVIAKGCATGGLVLIAALLSALIAKEGEDGR